MFRDDLRPRNTFKFYQGHKYLFSMVSQMWNVLPLSASISWHTQTVPSKLSTRP